MNVTAEKKDLDRAINLAMLASGRGAKDAALQNVLVRADKGIASVESYDTHVYSRATFPFHGEGGLEFAIEGTRLQHLIGTAVDGPVSFDVTTDQAAVAFARATINLRLFPVDKYVRIPEKEKKRVAEKVRAALLMQGLEFVRPFVGKDTQQPTRMLAELRSGRLMAGDGTRIAVVKFGLTGVKPEAKEGEDPPELKEVDFGFNLKVPQAVMSNVTRWLKDQVEGEDEALVDILEDEDFYFIRSSKSSVFAWRKPEHDFMSVEQYLERLEAPDGASKFKVDKESLERMVDSLSVVLEAGAEKVTFSLNGNPMMPMLQGRASDSRGVPSSNEVQIVVDGEKTEAEFSIRYSHILDTLKLLENPIVTCDVRREMSIVQVREDQPEMSKTALLTLMQEA
jgi:DNA polymerase III sliding clamp (beta) subunit (PCNA family)